MLAVIIISAQKIKFSFHLADLIITHMAQSWMPVDSRHHCSISLLFTCVKVGHVQVFLVRIGYGDTQAGILLDNASLPFKDHSMAEFGDLAYG